LKPETGFEKCNLRAFRADSGAPARGRGLQSAEPQAISSGWATRRSRFSPSS